MQTNQSNVNLFLLDMYIDCCKTHLEYILHPPEPIEHVNPLIHAAIADLKSIRYVAGLKHE